MSGPLKFIPYGRQYIDDGDISAVVSALRSDFLTTGPRVANFERGFADYVGAKHAIAVSSATAALHVAAAAVGLGSGDRVITSPNTFVASANAAAFVGAVPDFADIDPASYNLSPSALAAAWRADVRAVIPVAYAGQACDMPAIAAIARQRGAVIIEDASHGVGSGFIADGRTWRLGGHPWADLTVFSFHPVKTMTTGEGGIITTSDDRLADAARRLRSHGIERKEFVGIRAGCDPELEERGPWYYEMQTLGWNYRITDVQCALGDAQLKKLDSFISRRREIVARYNDAFAHLPWLSTPKVMQPGTTETTSWHLYTTEIDFRALRLTRTKVMEQLLSAGIGSQVLYIPVYLQPWYQRTYGYGAGKCPVAESVYRKSLSLPLYFGMSDSDVERVIKAVHGLA